MVGGTQDNVEKGKALLNSELEKIKLGDLPSPSFGFVLEFDDTASISKVAKQMYEFNVLSAPVKDPLKPLNSSWSEKYLGIVDFVCIVQFIVEQVNKKKAAEEGAKSLESTSFETILDEMEVFWRTPVSEITLSGYFAPFVFLETSDNLLDVVLLMGKHNLHRVPLIHSEKRNLGNFITQSSVLRLVVNNLQDCSPKACEFMNRSLESLPLPSLSSVWVARESEPLLNAFKLMTDKRVQGVALVDDNQQLVGNISGSDVRPLVQQSSLFVRMIHTNMTVFDFLVWKESVGEKVKQPLTCSVQDSLIHVVKKMLTNKVHRLYVVGSNMRPMGVVSFGDILSVMAEEPEGHFGTFFQRNTAEFTS